jgi:hypothetical protein
MQKPMLNTFPIIKINTSISAVAFFFSSISVFSEQTVRAQTAGCGSGSSWYLSRIGSPISANQFRIACIEHDSCYETYGNKKQKCDKAFHKRMLGICARDHNTIVGTPLKIACNGRADAYYSAVLEYGKEAYDKAQASASPSGLSSGFFKENGRPEVYFVNGINRTFCHVQNPSQMEVYGGFSRVKTVYNNLFRYGTQFAGPCLWPDGLYRSSDRPEVYYLYNNWKSACWVRTSQQVDKLGGWNRVKVVNQTSRESFIAGRSFSESC